MNRNELIKKAYAIANEKYEWVKECRNSDLKQKSIEEWATALDTMAELLNMSDSEYMGFFD